MSVPARVFDRPMQQNFDWLERRRPPVGAAFMWPPGVRVPRGYVELAGQALSAEQYPELFRVYGAALPDHTGLLAGVTWITVAR